MCSDIDQALNQMAEAVNESNKENSDSRISAYIELTDKGKIKWNGPFEELQKLMVKLTGKDISWTSPGRDCKMLSLNEAEVRWYANSKSLTVNGVKKEEIKSQLRVLSNLVNLDKDNTLELDNREAGESMQRPPYTTRHCRADWIVQSRIASKYCAKSRRKSQ